MICGVERGGGRGRRILGGLGRCMCADHAWTIIIRIVDVRE
jgi:hypothetical protein